MIIRWHEDLCFGMMERLLVSVPFRSVRGVCNFLGSVSPQQKFEAMDRPLLQLGDTAWFHLASKRKNILEAWGWADPKEVNRREKNPETPLFILFFFLPLNLPYVNWASQEGCLLHLRFLLWSSDCPLFYFCRLFLCLLATAIFWTPFSLF